MPIQIPTVKRVNAPEEASVGRIQAQVPNTAGAMDIQDRAIEKLGATAIDVYDKYEDAAADTEGMKRANEYDSWYRKQIEGDSQNNKPGLRHIMGDPTPAYNDFDKRASEKFDELSSGEDLSPKTRYAVNKALAQKHNSLYDTRLLYYGQQNAKYEEDVTVGAIEKEKLTAASTLGFIKADAPDSTMMFEKSKAQIESYKINQALKMGGAFESPEGKYLHTDNNGNTVRLNVNPSVTKSIIDERNKLVYNSIDTLIESGSLAEAKLMMTKFGGELDIVNKGKVQEKFDKADVEAKAYMTLASMEDKPYTEQKKILKLLPTKTPRDMKIKEESLKLLDANERYKITNQERDSKEVSNQILNFVSAKMRTDGAYDGVSQLEQETKLKIDGRNVRFKDAIQRVTDAGQRKAIYELVEQPKESDEEVKTKLMDMLREGEFYGMGYADLANAKVGLNKEDSKFIDREWTKQNTETDAQERSKVNYIGAEIYRQYTAAGLIRKAGGKETKSSAKDRNAFDAMIRKKAESFPKNMNPAEISEYIGRETVEEAKRQRIEKRGYIGELIDSVMGIKRETPQTVAPKRVKGSSRTGSKAAEVEADVKEVTTAPAPKTKELGALTPAERKQLWEDYKKANGKLPANAAELMKWNESR